MLWPEMATRKLMNRVPVAANMKVITSIYLNCRPELRDEWLAGQDQETELEDALVGHQFCFVELCDVLKNGIATRIRSTIIDPILQQTTLLCPPRSYQLSRTWS